MILRDILDLVNKVTQDDLEKKAINTAETIKYTVRKKAETVKDSSAHAEQEVRNVMKVVYEKKKGVKKGIKDSYYEIKEKSRTKLLSFPYPILKNVVFPQGRYIYEGE